MAQHVMGYPRAPFRFRFKGEAKIVGSPPAASPAPSEADLYCHETLDLTSPPPSPTPTPQPPQRPIPPADAALLPCQSSVWDVPEDVDVCSLFLSEGGFP
jgi:hypothetical protein